MSPDFEKSLAFLTACDLVLKEKYMHLAIPSLFTQKKIRKKLISSNWNSILKAEIKVPSSNCSISPPTGKPCPNLEILILLLLSCPQYNELWFVPLLLR